MTLRGDNWDAFVLVLIDVQKDFWKDAMSMDLTDYERNVTGLLEYCRREGIDVLHLRAEFEPDKSDWMASYKFGDSIPCIRGTSGVEAFDFAQSEPDETVMEKQCFDGFQIPDLEPHLILNDKRFLLVAGLVTSVCVLFTAASAAQRGYLVGLIEDCCADQPEAHVHTMERYPFVFDRVNHDQLGSRHDEWLRKIRQLSN